MKIRQGFVSNSSSSSFIVLLPEDFDESKLDFIRAIKEYVGDDIEDFDQKVEDLKNAFKKLLIERECYPYEFKDDIFDILSDLLFPWVIAEIQVGSDGGSISLVDVDKVNAILNGGK